MQRILVTGGTGVLGKRLVPHLVGAGYIVRLLSRRARQPGLPPEMEWHQADLEGGAGLEQAVEGVDTIIHAASSPTAAARVDRGGARNLLNASRGTGVGHFLYISIAGIDRHPFYYYRAKAATERVVQAGGLPWTILRATQFHELLDRVFLPPLFALPFLGLVPRDFQFQLIDSGEVAGRMLELVQAGPCGRAEDIGGPQVQTMGEIAQRWVQARRMRARIINLPLFGGAARAFREGLNTVPGARYGTKSWDDYLAETYPG